MESVVCIPSEGKARRISPALEPLMRVSVTTTMPGE